MKQFVFEGHHYEQVAQFVMMTLELFHLSLGPEEKNITTFSKNRTFLFHE